MELDHDTGAVRGRILAGRYEGTSLDTLAVATLIGLLTEIDEESRELLATYLDRREATPIESPDLGEGFALERNRRAEAGVRKDES
jgi:hypothetical protein